MRPALLCVLLSGCTLPLGPRTALRLSLEAQSRGRAVSTPPRAYLGLRLSLIHRP